MVDQIIARNAKRTLAKIKTISSDDFIAMLDAFLRMNDAWNIKIIADSIMGGKEPKAMLERYAKLGTFNPLVFATAKSIEELSRSAAKRVPELRKHPQTFAGIMDALFVVPKGAMSAYLIDERNIVRLIMLKRDNVPADQIIRRMQRKGTLPHGVLKEAASATSVNDVVRILRTTTYGKAVEHAATKNSLVQFEYELHHEMLRRIKKSAGRYPLSPEVAVRYLIEKDIEAANLRLLIKGKHLGLDEQFIKEQLVI